MIWEQWKKGFDAWEAATAKWLEVVLKSPLVLEPAGAMLTATMKMKVAQDEAWARMWNAIGLPSRRDQERLAYELDRLASRVIDLEDGE